MRACPPGEGGAGQICPRSGWASQECLCQGPLLTCLVLLLTRSGLIRSGFTRQRLTCPRLAHLRTTCARRFRPRLNLVLNSSSIPEFASCIGLARPRSLIHPWFSRPRCAYLPFSKRLCPGHCAVQSEFVSRGSPQVTTERREWQNRQQGGPPSFARGLPKDTTGSSSVCLLSREAVQQGGAVVALLKSS